MLAAEAKQIVLKAAERQKINQSWLARELGVKKQNVDQWLSGTHAPRDPEIWVKMAKALALINPIRSEIEEMARELALAVLVDEESASLKEKAANLLRYFL